ncbi:MAG: LapA family protein [Solirubrobacteraceae bacterium]|nr:LapA family protein [Solirubrobacteraceae bacterium]
MSDPQTVKIESKGAQPAPGGANGPAGGPGQGGAPATPGGANPKGTPPAPASGPGRVKRTARQVKQALLVIVGALIAIFAVTNRDPVRVNWIFGETASTPLILVIAITLVAGFVIGWLVAKLGNRKGD